MLNHNYCLNIQNIDPCTRVSEEEPRMNEEEEHMRHNRYRDMVAYESNVITLSSEQGSSKLCNKETLIPWLAGTPPTTYINASPISFENCAQTYIATQAPRFNTFQNFWTMILEKRVSVLVMITSLKEGGRTKAER